MAVKDRILELARRLAKAPKTAEYAVVVFEDGSEVWVRGSPLGAAVPIYAKARGRAVAIVHTHPVPRTTPSLADLQALLRIALLGAPAYMATVYRANGEAVVTLYTANTRITPEAASYILRESAEYERLQVQSSFSPAASEKQAREQHVMLRQYGITVERYSLKL